MHREACWAIVHRVAKIQTQSSNWAQTHSEFSKGRTLDFCSVHFSRSVVSKSLLPHGLQHTRPPCPSPTPRVYSNSCPLSRGCHPTISSSVVPFSSHLQAFPASGSFPMSQFFASGGQSVVVSASTSVFSMNIQDWFPVGWTSGISLQSKGLLSKGSVMFVKWGR